jgi:hypothetical protein
MPRKTRKAKALWATYVATMEAAEKAARALADALETYLRRGFHRDIHPSFDDACRAADGYFGAIRRAEPFHVGTMPRYYSGHVINSSADELIDVMRELRGTAVYHRVIHVDGRSIMVPRYADNSVAGFFRQEVKSMEPFGSPRRTPTKEELERVHNAA